MHFSSRHSMTNCDDKIVELHYLIILFSNNISAYFHTHIGRYLRIAHRFSNYSSADMPCDQISAWPLENHVLAVTKSFTLNLPHIRLLICLLRAFVFRSHPQWRFNYWCFFWGSLYFAPPSLQLCWLFIFFDYNSIQISQILQYKPKKWKTVGDPGHLIETS